jgi:hypothetical protein
MTASILNSQPCDLLQDLVRGVQGQFPDATPAEVTREVHLRLDRLQRAWRAARTQQTENGYLIRDWGPLEADPWSPRST